MKRTTYLLLIALLLPGIILTTGCRKKYEIRDVDPHRAGRVRSLGPESQDADAVADKMIRSLLASRAVTSMDHAPTIVMLPMANNTRHAFNQEVFSSLLKARLNQIANGQMFFVARDTWDDAQLEREMKRTGQVDYDPERRTTSPAGGDFFLRGRADGLASVSTKGQADYIVYTFKLVDAESMIEVWEDVYEVKKEGKDDVVYR